MSTTVRPSAPRVPLLVTVMSQETAVPGVSWPAVSRVLVIASAGLPPNGAVSVATLFAALASFGSLVVAVPSRVYSPARMVGFACTTTSVAVVSS